MGGIHGLRTKNLTPKTRNLVHNNIKPNLLHAHQPRPQYHARGISPEAQCAYEAAEDTDLYIQPTKKKMKKKKKT